MAGPLAGVGIYLCLNKWVYGEWTRFLRVQKEHWHQGPGLFYDTVRYELDYCVSNWKSGNIESAVFLYGAAAATILAIFAALAFAAWKLRAHHLAYALAYTVTTMGAAWLISAPRYAAVLFCVPMGIALGVKGKGAKNAALSASLVCMVLYTFVFLRHGPIY